MKKALRWLCLALLLVMLPAAVSADQQYFIDSDSRKITEEELWKWDRESLSFMFNEIFARHGFTFDAGGKYYNWFNSQPWYQSLEKVDDKTAYDRTTALEWENYHTIKKVIGQMEDAGHPYRKPRKSDLKSWIDFQPPGKWALTGFQYVSLKGEQMLDVYSAPGTASYRGANGKAKVSTNGAVWAAGWENGWLQVFYEVNNGGLRVGYVNGAQISGTVAFGSRLAFSYTVSRLIDDCRLTDDPLSQSGSITALRKGGEVTYLTTVTNQNGQVFDYVETSVGGQTVRGYIPSGCLEVPRDELPDLDDWAGK